MPRYQRAMVRTTTRGQKRILVTLEKAGPPVADADGGYTQTMVPLSPAQMRAEVKPATVRDLERLVASTVQSSATQIITMDFHPDVDQQTRVTWTDVAGRAHAANVTGVSNPDGRCLESVLVCEEAVQ